MLCYSLTSWDMCWKWCIVCIPFAVEVTVTAAARKAHFIAMGDRVECLLKVNKAHIEWLLVLACLVHRYSEICDLVSCPLPCRNPASSSAISVSVIAQILSSMIRRRIFLYVKQEELFCNLLWHYRMLKLEIRPDLGLMIISSSYKRRCSVIYHEQYK